MTPIIKQVLGAWKHGEGKSDLDLGHTDKWEEIIQEKDEGVVF